MSLAGDTCSEKATTWCWWRPGRRYRWRWKTAELLDRSVRVVSLPCWEAFARQESGYQDAVLGVGHPEGFDRGRGDLRMGADRRGASVS